MSSKRAARRRAAKIRDKAQNQELSPEQEAGISTVALLLAMGATDPATVYVAQLALERPGKPRVRSRICAKERPMESQTIELGAATLAALQALVPPPGMTPLAWVALGVGLGQLMLLTVGLGLMYRSNTSREQQTRAQAQAEAQRHAETMEAFRLQATASSEQHEATLEALRQQGVASREQHEATLEALRQQEAASREQHTATMRALETLIERTAPESS
ncbi:MAG: hypothetical protein OXM01_06120 [Gemmatimonadota bacterium]|nr:hypothetical protein [Gemmatimonadota bacterium]